MLHIDIPDLTLFVCIAESPSLTKGARKACVSAAAASARVKSLEQRVGVRLFYRDSKGMELTGAGHRFLRHARVILRQMDHLKSDFDVQKSADFGHIRLYANTTSTTEYLPGLLAYYLSNHPGIYVDLKEKQNAEVIRSVRDGTCDVGIVAGDIQAHSLEVIPFAVDKLVLIVPRDHPLAERESVSFYNSLNYQQVGLNEGSTLTEFLKVESQKTGTNLDIRIQVNGFESVFRMVDSGVGIAIVPLSTVTRLTQFDNIKCIELNESWALRKRFILVRELASLPSCAIGLINKILADHGKDAVSL